MPVANRSSIEFIRDFSRFSLIGLLLINLLSPFAILFINPEAFFLGQKIAGTGAVAYALGLILVTAILIFCLYFKTKGYAAFAFIYGIIWFVNGYLTVLYYNNQVPPAIYWLILLLSVVLAGTSLLSRTGKPAGPHDKSGQTIFEKNPRIGLLLSVCVLACFLLYSSIGLISYQKEYNTWTYRIEIDADTPLHNVTLIVPLPPDISQEINSNEMTGSNLPYFTNYSQSVIETQNGTMLKITADSIERPGQGVPDGPLQLYYNIMAEGEGSSASIPVNQPLLLPEGGVFGQASCSDMQFQGALSGNNPAECSRYESGFFAEFETNPASQTIIIVSFDHTRMISSSQSPRRDAFQEYITASISGSADGWYDAPGSILVTAES